jgi:hypothetical protein
MLVYTVAGPVIVDCVVWLAIDLLGCSAIEQGRNQKATW